MFFKNTTPLDVKAALRMAVILNNAEIMVFRLAYKVGSANPVTMRCLKATLQPTCIRDVHFRAHNFTGKIVAKAKYSNPPGGMHDLIKPSARVRAQMSGKLYAILQLVVSGLMIVAIMDIV